MPGPETLPPWPQGFEQQPNWVLQSASADHPISADPFGPMDPMAQQAVELLKSGYRAGQEAGLAAAEAEWRFAHHHHPRNLWLARGLNRVAPNLLEQRIPRRWRRLQHHKPVLAVLIPGELRCLSRSGPLLKQLGRIADLFITTTSGFRSEALALQPKDLQVVEDNPELVEAERDLEVGSMRQWHKLAACCRQMRAEELRRGRPYRWAVKWRTDFYLLEPHQFLQELSELDRDPDAGLIGASDKLFAGSRDLMLRLEGFWHALQGQFLDLDPRNSPVHLETILRGDESAKWYGFGLPERLVGRPASVPELRHTLQQGGSDLARALSEPWLPDEPLVNFFPGHPRFPSEVAFARFLNQLLIPMRGSRALSGFLYSDRSHYQ